MNHKVAFRLCIALLAVFFGMFAAGASAQSQQVPSQLFVTGGDASSAPAVAVHLYAVDSQGNKADLSNETFSVVHNSQAVEQSQIGGTYVGGTFTIFLVDIPQGVSSMIPTIQNAILQYANNPYMMENVDSVGIFRVDEVAAVQILEPAAFYNSVANAFANPLAASEGNTALVDSIMGLLNSIDQHKPRADMVTHFVVISDGTDVVSTQFQPEDVPAKAAELGVQIHTLHLDNQSLQPDRALAGQQYMSQIAAGTRGLSFEFSSIDQLASLWDRITSFREQDVLTYTLTDLVGGDYPVEVALASNLNLRGSTTVTLPPGAPTVELNIPEEGRTMTLETLDQPVTLSFSTSVAWLDGATREVSSAQLLVNGIVDQEIDPAQLDRFDAVIDNLVYGNNTFQVAVVDDQGSRAASRSIAVTVNQGQTQIPEAVQPLGLFERIWGRVSGFATAIGGCLLILVLLVVMYLLFRMSRRSRILQRLGVANLLRRVPFLRPYVREADQIRGVGRRASYAKRSLDRYKPEVKGVDTNKKKGAFVPAVLDVLSANTRITGKITLDQPEVKIGRSPAQASVVFDKDSTVSRIHATIVQEGADYRIFDEQSTSGTFVNEQRVLADGLQLVNGDEIRLGAVRLRFRNP